MILENCPITIVRNLLVYSRIQYGTIVVIVMIVSVIEQYHNTL